VRTEKVSLSIDEELGLLAAGQLRGEVLFESWLEREQASSPIPPFANAEIGANTASALEVRLRKRRDSALKPGQLEMRTRLLVRHPESLGGAQALAPLPPRPPRPTPQQFRRAVAEAGPGLSNREDARKRAQPLASEPRAPLELRYGGGRSRARA
jgi:hypothetical protein